MVNYCYFKVNLKIIIKILKTIFELNNKIYKTNKTFNIYIKEKNYISN